MNVSSRTPFPIHNYESRTTKGHVTGMNDWGTERPIEPQEVDLSVSGKDSMNLDVIISGVPTDEGVIDPEGYTSVAQFHGFPREALPVHGGLTEGVLYRNERGNQSMSYNDGTLTLTSEETHYKPGPFNLGIRETEINLTVVEVETNPELTKFGNLTYRETSRDKKLFGGYEAPETITDLQAQDFYLLP